MLSVNNKKLNDLQEEIGDPSEQSIQLMFLVPNRQLTEEIFVELESDRDENPDIMLHDWHRVVVDLSNDETTQVLYTEEEPFRMLYKGEYSIEDTARIDRTIHYQDTISVDSGLQDNLEEWIRRACSDIDADADQVIDEIERRVLPNVDGDRAIFVASRHKLATPP